MELNLDLTKEEVREQLTNIDYIIDEDAKKLTMRCMMRVDKLLAIYHTVTDKDPLEDSDHFSFLFEYLTDLEFKKLFLLIHQTVGDGNLNEVHDMYLNLAYLQMIDYLSIPCRIFSEDSYVDAIIKYAGKYIDQHVMESKHEACHFIMEAMGSKVGNYHSGRINPN